MPRSTLSLLVLVGLLAGCASNQSSSSTRSTAVESRPEAYALIAGEKVPVPAIQMGDPKTIAAILNEGKNRNKVMDHLTHLCEVIGPRLTGSTKAEIANYWTRDQFALWGLTNSRVEPWGTIAVRFDRGPSTGKVLLRRETRNEDGTTRVEHDTIREMEFTTLAWAAGTSHPVRGHVIRMPQTEEEFAAVAGSLEGAWVLQKVRAPGDRAGIRGVGNSMRDRLRQIREARAKVASEGTEVADLPIFERVALSGIAGFLSTTRDDRVWTTSADGWRELDPNNIPPDVEVSLSFPDYDFINSRLADGESIELEFDLQNRFSPGPIPVYNTIAEIRGSTWPDEVVIVSAHLDSWNGPGSLGTVDNGTGSAVTLEAARILAAVGAKPKRTIRFILWTGEEQGLLGSRAYVESLGDELDRISAVFVDDGGTNYEGGLTGTVAMRDYLAAATAPVNGQFFSETDNKHLDVNIQTAEFFPRFGGSDHASFVARGVPGFFWQEVGRANYSHGWHTQYDRLDQAIPEYLIQSSTCAAITAYNLACAPSLLPRDNMNRPEGEGQGDAPRGGRPARQ